MAITITLEQVRNMIAVNKHRLDDELEVQPDVMERIASQVVVRNSRMLEAKDDLTRVEGRLTLEAKEDDPKLTVDGVSAVVKRSTERTRAWQKFQQARHEHEEWVGALEAWRQKGYSLKTLSDLYAAQYFSVNSTSVSPRQQARNERDDDARAAIRVAGARAGGSHTPIGDAQREECKATPRRRVLA
jgi:hypothetical protein